jgi:hypothetical protein
MVQIESRGLRFASLPATSVPVLDEVKKEEGIKNERLHNNDQSR